LWDRNFEVRLEDKRLEDKRLKDERFKDEELLLTIAFGFKFKASTTSVTELVEVTEVRAKSFVDCRKIVCQISNI